MAEATILNSEFWGVPVNGTLVRLDHLDVMQAVTAFSGLARMLAAGAGLALACIAVGLLTNSRENSYQFARKLNWHQIGWVKTSKRRFKGICLLEKLPLMAGGHRLDIPVQMIVKYTTLAPVTVSPTASRTPSSSATSRASSRGPVGDVFEQMFGGKGDDSSKKEDAGAEKEDACAELLLSDGALYRGNIIGIDRFEFITPLGVQSIKLSEFHDIEGCTEPEKDGLIRQICAYLDERGDEVERVVGPAIFARYFGRI